MRRARQDLALRSAGFSTGQQSFVQLLLEPPPAVFWIRRGVDVPTRDLRWREWLQLLLPFRLCLASSAALLSLLFSCCWSPFRCAGKHAGDAEGELFGHCERQRVVTTASLRITAGQKCHSNESLPPLTLQCVYINTHTYIHRYRYVYIYVDSYIAEAKPLRTAPGI